MQQAVLILSDGRPGHYRQSEGVVAALRRHRATTERRIEIANRLRLPKALVPKLARRLPPRIALEILHGIDVKAVSKPALIVSGGGLTLGANVALANILGVPNVFCGATRGFALENFSLVLSDDPRDAGPPNVRIGPKPAAFDPDTLPAPPSTLTGRGLHIGVLVGGATETSAFRGEDWGRLVHLIEALIADKAATITLATSPRTPPEAYSAIESLTAASGSRLALIDFRTAGPGSLGPALATDLLLVTSDSMTMMTEAALSRRPAIALRPQRIAPTRDDGAIAWLVAQQWLAVRDIASTDADNLLETAASLRPMIENHLDLLAQSLLPLVERQTSAVS
jgi:uncharacterized protein